MNMAGGGGGGRYPNDPQQQQHFFNNQNSGHFDGHHPDNYMQPHDQHPRNPQNRYDLTFSGFIMEKELEKFVVKYGMWYLWIDAKRWV